MPDLLTGRTFVLDGEVAADIAEAEAAILALDGRSSSLANTEGIARLMLRAEAVASSRIEGLEVGPRRLLRAEVAQAIGERSPDVTAMEVLRNIEAMRWAVERGSEGGEVTVDDLLSIHRRLLAGTRYADHAGRLRTDQNWIGGSGTNPCSAVYVPPPPEEVASLMADLCAFVNDDGLSPLAQAAVAHAQFETIHPFADGNGRTGRALIYLILRRRGLARRILPPVSLVLATWSKAYIEGLVATRYTGSADSAAAQSGMNRWLEFFASACARAVADATHYEQRIMDMQVRWEGRLGRVRRGSAAAALLAALPATPIVTVPAASATIGRSYEATNNAIERLVEAGILRQVRVGRRNRAFEAPEVIDAFADLERTLGDPKGVTRLAPRGRPAPPNATDK